MPTLAGTTDAFQYDVEHETPRSPPPADLTQPLVLIVDDSLDARLLYGEFLEMSGFRVLTAADGEEAVAMATTEWPAIILMDLAMPRVDGWEAIRRLRAEPMTAEIPIVALSAYAFGDEPVRAREAGADLYLTKPCLPSQVVRVVRAMLVRRQIA